MPLPVQFRRLATTQETEYKPVDGLGNKPEAEVTVTPFVPGWPTEPQRIAKAPFWIIVDFLLLLMPIAFIALAALAYKLDGQELSDRGRSIQEAILLGPTLYPLAFAALGGRSLKKIALWRAQRGTTLGFLEHLIGSQSLVGTVGHALALRSFDILTLCLLALWALSPLGGQSALRLVHETNSTTVDNRSVFYANMDAFSQFMAQSYNEDAFNRANAVLMASLMTVDTLENSTIDTWNHPKIPRLEVLEQAEERNETTRDWYTVDTSVNHSYASLAGVPVINLSETGTANLTVPYEYMYFGCSLSPHNNINRNCNQTTGTCGQPYTNTSTQMKYLNSLDDAGMLDSANRFIKNATSLSTTSAIPGAVVGSSRSFFIFTEMTKTGTSPYAPKSLLYGSSAMVSTVFWLFECSMRSITVEANIICNNGDCKADRLRRYHRPREERLGSSLPYDFIHDGHTNTYLTRHLVAVGGENSNFAANPVDAYIYGMPAWDVEENGLRTYKLWETYVNDTEKTKHMSHRLTRFLNTFLDASRWPAMTRNDPFAKKSLNETSGLPPARLNLNATQAVVTTQVPIYRASAGWVAGLVICSCVLLLLGICSFFLSFQITAPDIFDYVSSFTRDNPYVNAPVGGSGLDGAERARLLRKLPVQLGDVNSAENTGYIAIRTVDGSNDCDMGQIKRDRLYR